MALQLIAALTMAPFLTGAAASTLPLPWVAQPAEVRAVVHVLGAAQQIPVMLIGLSDGKVVAIRDTGSTGQNMFAITATSNGFATVPGYHHLIGSQKFSSGVRGLYYIGGYTFVALDNGLLIKIAHTGGSGTNMFAVNQSGNTVTGLPGYNYWAGTQVFSSPV